MPAACRCPAAELESTLPVRTTLLAAAISLAAFGESLPTARRPEDVGFSSERLARITRAFQSDVDHGLIPGAVILIARDGKAAYLKAFGYQNQPQRVSMRTDSIFRIASMTKPITSVAVMMLAEEGSIDIGGPVSRYLPEFKDLKVGVEHFDPDTGTPKLSFENPKRPMTVQDLPRHTAGLTYGFFGNSLVDREYVKANLFDRNQTLTQMVAKLSKLPLAHQPGATWDYSMSVDVLGRIVEVVSGMPLDQFVRDRITRPLQMSDSDFSVSSAQAARVAEPQTDPVTGKRPGTCSN